MRRFRCGLVTLLGGLSLSSPAWCQQPVDATTMSGVQVFLGVYQTLSEGHSAFFYELYSDQARIVMQVPGHAPMLFPGVSYKVWGKELIARAQAFPDGSRFDAPQVVRRGARLDVRVSRHSLSRCYADPGYSLVLELFGTGFRILEERLTLQPAARCASPEGLASQPASARPAAPALPHATWRPMSPEEINTTALRLAQQAPARPESKGVPLSNVPPDPPAAAARARSDLWVSPREGP